MLKQIKYFQAVVRTNSFSAAADECFISQSAVSQQIKALENELGFDLLVRNNKKIRLTPAGEYFYKKSLILVSDYDRICSESARIARNESDMIRIGYLTSYSGSEIRYALERFTEMYPNVTIRLINGSHEDLFSMLRSGGADMVLNDQRRAFSDEYINMVLLTKSFEIEISQRYQISICDTVAIELLKDIPCIIVASESQRENERDYYRNIIGVGGEFIYAENLEQARLMVISGCGFMPVDGSGTDIYDNRSVRRVSVLRDKESIDRNYCLFWKKDNSGYYIEEFADILKDSFSTGLLS